MRQSFNENTRPTGSRYRLVDFYTMREIVSQTAGVSGGSPVTERLVREYHFHKGTDPSQPKEPFASEWRETGNEITPLATRRLDELDPRDVRDAYNALLIFGGMPEPLQSLLRASAESGPGAFRKFLNSFLPGR